MDYTVPPKVSPYEKYFDLGSHHWKISTLSTEAQIWFDRGLIWSYAFNQDEAALCFWQVISHDPDCAMGYWGVAYALGPNHNKTWDFFTAKELANKLPTMRSLTKKAQQVAAANPATTPAEKALCKAIEARDLVSNTPEGMKGSTKNYADAMREVEQEFGKDHIDIVALTVESFMIIAPWRMYNSATGEPDLATPVLETKALVERNLSLPAAQAHPGLLHFYIHLMEMSKNPEAAMLAADKLRDLVPGGGHISHMPSHIDLLVGDYRRALNTNYTAIRADEAYQTYSPENMWHRLYALHNIHTLLYAAMLAGNQNAAMWAANRITEKVTDDFLKITIPDMANFAESFLHTPVHAMIRFGMWEEIKALDLPENQELRCSTTAVIYYGKGLAYAATGDVPRAEKQQALFTEAVKTVPETRLDFPVRVVDELAIAAVMLDGEIEYRKGHFEKAFKQLREAVRLDDALTYAEPWGWMLPSRHPLAALLLEQGHVQEAMELYMEDLGIDEKLVRGHQHPNNVWALSGYLECLTKLKHDNEAAIIRRQLSIAEAGATIKVQNSCFCRLGKDQVRHCS